MQNSGSKKAWLRLGAALLAISLTVPLWAQTAVPGGGKPAVQKKTYNFEEAKKADMEYALFVHSKYDKAKKSPLIVALHGLGGNPSQFIRTKGVTDLAEKYGYIVVAPFGYNSSGWYGAPGMGGIGGKGKGKGGKDEGVNVSEMSEKDVMNVLALIRKEYTIDDQRIYLMGHSMGGGGTWHIGIKFPEIWAGLAPIAPAVFARNPKDVAKIKDIPVILVQGDKDNLVPVATARKWADEMKKLGMTYDYLEIAGGDHGSVVGQNMPKIYEFFNKHSRKVAAPALVR